MESNYINIKEIAEAKGLKSTRSLRLQINKPNSPYIAREVEVNGGTSYEILYSTLEPEIQELLRTGETKSTALQKKLFSAIIMTRCNLILMRQNGQRFRLINMLIF